MPERADADTATTPPDSLPRHNRYFFPLDEQPPLDREGFLQVDAAERLRELERSFLLTDLLEQRAVVMVGPPYAGKSYAMRAARGWVRTNGNGTHVLYRDLRSPNAEWAIREENQFRDWQASTERLVWLIDSVDEGLERGEDCLNGIEDRIESFAPNARERLRLLVSCRQNDVPEELSEMLGTLLGECLVVRIAPLSREDAVTDLGAEFDRICELIRTNRLSDFAAQPSVLKSLERNTHLTGTISRSIVWRAVLEGLLERAMPSTGVGLTQVFEAACRIAFVQTFSDRLEVGLGENSVFASVPTLGQLFADDTNHLLGSARQALRSGLFERTETGFRSSHRHVREWLTAFQLAALVRRGGKNQMIELLSDQAGIAPQHLELAAATLEVLRVRR